MIANHEVIGPDSTKLDNIWEDMFVQLPPIKGQRSSRTTASVDPQNRYQLHPTSSRSIDAKERG
jgi:hypothetical protein